MTFPPELLDQLLAGRETPEEIFGAEGLFGQLKKALAERALAAELGHHLTQEQQAQRPNHRNGSSAKTGLTDTGKLPLEIPRDRAGTFAPQLVPKHQRRLPGFDAKVLSLYAHGMTFREMREPLTELYGTDVSPDLISTVTDAVGAEVTEWQQRPLQGCYPVLLSTPGGSRSATKAPCAIKPSTSPWASPPMGPRTCSGSGSSKPKGPSSGCGS